MLAPWNCQYHSSRALIKACPVYWIKGGTSNYTISERARMDVGD